MNNFSVLHSFPVWLPQTQTWMYNQVHQLQQMGVDAHVICERTQHLDQFQVANIHCLSNEPLWRQVWDKSLRLARVRKHLNFLVTIGCEVGAQIVHSHFGHIGWRNLAAVRVIGAKHVVTFYGVDVNMLPMQSPKWRRRYHKLFDEVDLVLCEGLHMASCIVALGCPADKIRVQHLGVNVDQIQYRPRQYREGDLLRVLIAASFREKKGIPDAIKALGRLKKNIALELTIIGDAGQEKSSQREKRLILEELERNDFSSKVRLLGYQSHKGLLAEAYQHHIFLSPSVTASDGDTEGGAPVSLIEMAASGMPIVSTVHCDIPEIIRNGETGLLAAEHDVEGLAHHLRWWAEHPQNWQELLSAGRLHVEQKYWAATQARKLAAHYRSLLEPHLG